MHDDDDPPARSGDDATKVPMDPDADPIPAGIEGKLDVEPGSGGYAGRDPKTDTPRMPSIPATQDDD